MSKLPLFGFSLWDLRPDHDESTLGFFDRMIERNGDDNIKFYNVLNGMKESSITSEEVLDHLLRYPFSEDVKAHLRDAAAVTHVCDRSRKTSTVLLRGEILNSQDVRIASKRWCPACLAEKRYRRLWFDLVPLKVCPYHDIPIEDRTSDDTAVKWHRLGYQDIRGDGPAHPRSRLRENSFGHYLLGRLRCEKPFAVSLLDDAELRHVIDACEAVGVLLSRDRQALGAGHAVAGEIEVGFDAIRRGPAHLAKTLGDWAMHHVGDDDLQSLSTAQIFTWAYLRTSSQCGDVLGPFIASAMHSANALCKARGGLPISDVHVTAGKTTLAELAGRFGLRERSVSKAMKELGLLEHRVLRRRCVSEADVPAVTAFFESLVNGRELSRILGVSSTVHHHLIQAGMIRAYLGRLHGRAGPWFRREDIKAVSDRLRALPRRADPDCSRCYLTAARFRREKPGKLMVAILRGEVAICDFKPQKTAFAGIAVDIGERRKRERFVIGADEMTTGEIAAVLGVQKPTVWALVTLGLIRPTRSKGRWRFFKRTDIEKFAATHSRDKMLIAALGMRQGDFVSRMAKAGVKPVVHYGQEGSLNTLFNRAQVLDALGLDETPVQIADPRLDKLWRQLIGQAMKQFPTLRLPSTFPPAGCWAATPYNPRVAKFQFDRAKRRLEVDLPPMSSGRSFEFDVTADFKQRTARALFAALNEINNVERAKRALYARRYRKTQAHRRDDASLTGGIQ